MKKFTNSKAFWLGFSILASLLLWVYVTSMEGDDYQQTFRNVPVEIVGGEALKNSKNLEITDVDTAYVSVQIIGPRRIVGSLSSADLTAQIDVSKLSRSAYMTQQYSIVYPDGTDTSKLTVTRKTPEAVSFVVSGIVEKTVQVKGSFTGSIAEGYTAQKAEFEPSTITLRGPENYLKNISYAWVTFGEGEVNMSYSVQTTFTLMDDSGNKCDTTGISFSDETVVATLPILEVKSVPLKVNLIYGAGATEANTKVTIEPQSITLSGDSSLLNDYNQIVLGTIDTTDIIAKTEEMIYTITFDNELNNITGITEAKVVVEVSGLETEEFNVTNLVAGTVPEGYEAVINNEQLKVTIRGALEQLEKITADSISAIIDWSDFNAAEGTQELPAKIRIDVEGTGDCGAIFDYYISTNIKKVKK